MFERISRSWAIARSSARVLQADKELVALPAVGMVATIVVAAVFGAVAWLTVEETTDAFTGLTEYDYTPATIAVGLVGYVLITFTGVFFTAALVAGAHERLTGGDPTVGSALAAARRRIGQIFLWSVVVSTVGLVLRAIEERFGFVGALIARTLAVAWNVVTWLAIPIILAEEAGPVDALKRSGELFKRTWGENLAAQLGFGLVGFVLFLPGLVVGGVIAAVAPIVGIVLMLLYLIVVALVLSALNGIYRAALYLYATTGEVPDGYERNDLAGAFAAKPARSSGLGGLTGR